MTKKKAEGPNDPRPAQEIVASSKPVRPKSAPVGGPDAPGAPVAPDTGTGAPLDDSAPLAPAVAPEPSGVARVTAASVRAAVPEVPRRRRGRPSAADREAIAAREAEKAAEAARQNEAAREAVAAEMAAAIAATISILCRQMLPPALSASEETALKGAWKPVCHMYADSLGSPWIGALVVTGGVILPRAATRALAPPRAAQPRLTVVSGVGELPADPLPEGPGNG